MRSFFLPAMLLLLSGCITINFNQAPRTADDKATTTREQSSGRDEAEDCDEQVQSAAQLVGSARDTGRAVSPGPKKTLAEDQETTCLEDESGLHRRQKSTSGPTTLRSSRPIEPFAPRPTTHEEGTGAGTRRSNHL